MEDQSKESNAADSSSAVTPEKKDTRPHFGRTFSICKTADRQFEVHKIDCKCRRKVTWPHYDRELWIRANSWEEAVQKARTQHRRERFRIMGCTMAVTGCFGCGKLEQGALQCWQSGKWFCRDCGVERLVTCRRRRSHRFLPEFTRAHERWCKRNFGI